MREIVNEVLGREDEAAALIGESERKAREIGAAAEKFYNDTLKAAREESRKKLSEGTEEIRRSQEDRVAQALADYEKKWETQRDQGRERLEGLAEKLARRIGEL
jgi:hypothetical protein